MATLFLVSPGTQVVKKGRRRWVDPHWFRGSSDLKIGWRWVKQASTKGYRLIKRFSLSAGDDPDPARSSRHYKPARSIASESREHYEIVPLGCQELGNQPVKDLSGNQTMIVYLVLAILKERYHLQPSLSKLLHFLEVNLFEQKPLISIFQSNARTPRRQFDNQLKLFDL